MSSNLKVEFWLIVPSAKEGRFSSRYKLLQPRVASGNTERGKLRVAAGEVPIRCSISLPAALFAEPPPEDWYPKFGEGVLVRPKPGTWRCAWVNVCGRFGDIIEVTPTFGNAKSKKYRVLLKDLRPR